MNKVGLITFYKDNFGSILQCYATKRVLEEMGYECDVLYEIVNNSFLLQQKVTGLIKLIHGYLFDREYVEKRMLAKNTPQPLSRKTWNMMDAFVKAELKPKGYSFGELCNLEKKYDAFIVGSDQVWNAFNPILQSQFLKFTTDNKKIAFAVSLGTDSPTGKFLKTIKEGLKGFYNISVREESGVDIVKMISDVPVERIADPTLMLDEVEWRKFFDGVENIRDYILVHFLNKPNDIAIKKIENIRKEYGLKVVCIGYRYDIFNKYLWDYFDCDPKEYVAYINNASYVCTDSFHTTLFSINFGKEFFVFDRQYLHSHPQTSRISDMLKRYGLDDRLVKNIDISVSSIVGVQSALLTVERNKIRKYLKDEMSRIYER